MAAKLPATDKDLIEANEEAVDALQLYLMTGSATEASQISGFPERKLSDNIRRAKKAGLLRELEGDVNDLMRHMMMSTLTQSMAAIQDRLSEATLAELIVVFDKVFTRYQVIRGEASQILERRDNTQAKKDLREELADVFRAAYNDNATRGILEETVPDGSRTVNREPEVIDVIDVEPVESSSQGSEDRPLHSEPLSAQDLQDYIRAARARETDQDT